jgi:hypothetical protein
MSDDERYDEETVGGDLYEEGNHFRFYTKPFRDDQPREFLSHYAGVLGDALNPSMALYWQTSIFTERGRKIRVERNGLLAALAIIVRLASKNSVDIRPFLWIERYIKGNVDRDPDVLVEARYRFQELSLKATGEAGEGWREWDEKSRAASRTMNEVDDLFEQLIEFAPSLPSLWGLDSTSDTFALRDARELVDDSRQSWSRLGSEFPAAAKDNLSELLIRVRGHLRRLSTARYRGASCEVPGEIPHLADELLEMVTGLAKLYGTDLAQVDGAAECDDSPASENLEAAPAGWLRVKDAATAAGALPYEISKAITNGHLKAIGRPYRWRVCPTSLSEWQLKRANAPLRRESNTAVRRRLDRASDD